MNKNAIPLIEKNINKITWSNLSRNPNAVPILEKNIDKIDWYCLSQNPNGISILEKNLDKVNWNNISLNKNAVHLLEKNLEKIDWKNISANPSIFVFDSNAMKKQCRQLAEELAAYVFNPKRIIRFSLKYNIEFDLLLEIY